ncbi:MAG: hypothetical protein QOI95_2527 [Acidimicrobiaceae bacterium]|jgi:hypothetical protein
MARPHRDTRSGTMQAMVDSGSPGGMRLRVVSRGRFGRFRYEIESPEGRHVTRAPVTRLDPYLGVGDAWALVHAAQAAWDGAEGGWVSLTDHAPS